jgi:hypothetical protein
MMTATSDWIDLTPKLRSGNQAMRYFTSFVRNLSEAEYDRLILDGIRSEFLHHADQCGEDRQTLRVLVAILCDLKSKGWQFRLEDGKGAIAPPTDDGGSVLEQKDRVRTSLLVERDAQLRTPAVRAFVKSMEQRHLGLNDWTSIFSVMRDGRELTKKLRDVRKTPDGPDRHATLQKVIDPYIQFVDAESVCEHTGLRLGDIWRYFRHTWTTPYTNAPGRKFWILARDRAVKNHPVIGIAAFGNAVVQLGPRDEWIGWTAKQFLNTLKKEPSRDWAVWLKKSMEEMEDGIFVADFLKEKLLTKKESRQPSDDVIERMVKLTLAERKLHDLNPQADTHKTKDDWSEEGEWLGRAKTHLFRAKRAEALGRMLKIRKALNELGFNEPTREGLQAVLDSSIGRRAVEMILRQVKATHIGINLLEITICGAVAPYKSLLGGKLMAMLLSSPEVVLEYERKYAKSSSLIASSMAGRAIQRRPNLVALGTTSLYGAGSAMYNRISIPAEEAGGAKGEIVRYEELGKSVGFGSIQFSQGTINEMEAILQAQDGGRQIYHIFGEGVSPRLRKARAGMEAVGLPPDKLLKHGSPRIVYGVALAEQFREVLLGRRKNKPRYFLPFEDPAEVTRQIADYWMRRWLSKRIDRDEALEQAEAHTLVYPISHGARVDLPRPDNEGPDLFSGLED